MNHYTREQLLVLAKFIPDELAEIARRRREHNRLGFAYQLAFVRVYNRFPIQRPALEIDNELLTYVGVQLELSPDLNRPIPDAPAHTLTPPETDPTPTGPASL